MSKLDLADGHLVYDEIGSGPPVVLLHDGTLDRRVWAPQLDAFDGYRLLVLDARGHGESSTPTEQYQRADDVVALLDHLDLPSAYLVGQSMGGTMALDTALDHPDRVLGIVISGCGTSEQYWQSPFVVDLLRAQIEAAFTGDTDGYLETFLRLWVDGPARTPDEVAPDIRARCRDMAAHTAAHHKPVREVIMPGKALDTWARLPRIDRPLLAIAGDLDCEDIGLMVDRVVAAVPGARLDVFPGCGHMVNLEQPAGFNDTVRSFLDAVVRAAA